MRCDVRRRSLGGFTLVEVLAALVFMGILIPVTMEAVRVASRAGQVMSPLALPRCAKPRSDSVKRSCSHTPRPSASARMWRERESRSKGAIGRKGEKQLRQGVVVRRARRSFGVVLRESEPAIVRGKERVEPRNGRRDRPRVFERERPLPPLEPELIQ